MNPLSTRPLLTLSTCLVAGAVLLLCSCKQNTVIPDAPPVRRPKPVRVKKAKADIPDDCQATDPRSLPPSVSYKERSIAESKNLADQAFTLLRRAEDKSIPKIEREGMISDSVDLFITALLADPYNVHATYNLAAAYARIDRPQCAANLLERLVNLRALASQKDAVEEKLDRLLGRGKFRRKLDPDFRAMRDMELFRELVKEFCPSLPANAPLDRCQ